MILDSFSHVEEYALPHLPEALACFEQVKDLAPGRYEYDGGFILIQEGTPSPITAGDFEAHRKFLDVQVLLAGAETIAWADLAELRCSEEYDAGKDRGMYAGEGTILSVKPGMCYVCFPHDGHKACGHVSEPTPFRKAVIKLKIEEN